jgi:hypothetical protein
MFNNEQPLAFLHLPKAAGNTIAAGLRQAVAPRREAFGWDFSTFGSFRDIDSLQPHVRKVFYPSPDCLPAGADFITGHIAYSTITTRFPSAQCITFLREPSSRLLSQFMFMRSHQDAGMRPWGSYADRQRLAWRPLAEYLGAKSIAAQTDNLLCRLLLWPNPLTPEDDFINPANDRAIATQAQRRLDRLAYTDIVENPALAKNLSAWLNRPFSLGRENETLRIPPEHRLALQDQLTPQALRLLENHTRLDAPLWSRLVRRQMPAIPPEELRRATLLKTAARHATLLMP